MIDGPCSPFVALTGGDAVATVDGGRRRRDDAGVDEQLDPREAARVRRRDREADAEARDLMRPGMGKVFKQILDAQGKAASEAQPTRRRRSKKPR